ncbi:MAG: nuclear transport factor 2 family protein [Halioglobus sp.]
MMSIGSALEVSKRSLTLVEQKDKLGWLALFDDDAVVADPVGVSPLDPDGEGHCGIIAIEAFWDNIIGPGQLQSKIRESYESGDSVANLLTLTGTLADGTVIHIKNVSVLRVNSVGKIMSIHAYWNYKLVQDDLNRALTNRDSNE